MRHIVGKLLTKITTFLWLQITIEGVHKKLWVCKVAGVLVVKILRLPLGSPGTKCYLDVGLVERHIVYYKEEGGDFPQIQAVVSLVNQNLPVACPSTKNAPTMH